MKLLTPFLLLAAVSRGVHALYSARDAVVQITPKNFKEEVLDTEHVVIAEFFAPWCGHCKNLVPEYKKAAEKLKGLAKVVAVDCDSDPNKQICGQYDVKGFPTIKIFSSGPKGIPQDYNGPRTAKGMVDAVVSKLGNHVAQIGGSGKRAVALEDFLKKSDLARAVLVSQKSSTPPLLKALSVEYRNRLNIGEVKASEKEVVAKLNVTQFPAVILFPKDSMDPVPYEGQLKSAGLTEFFNLHAAPKPQRKTSGKDTRSDRKPPKEQEPPKAPEVIEAKDQSDVTACLEKPGFCVLSFLALEPEYEESLKAHNEYVKLLQDIAKTNHGFRYIWVNAIGSPGAQRIMRELQMSDSLPGLVAIHGTKKAFRLLTGPFDKQGIESFLKEVSSAKGRFFRFDTLPPLTTDTSKREEGPAPASEIPDRAKDEL